MLVLVKFFLFFSWFISFSVFNIDSIGWGLQVSWLLGVVIVSASMALWWFRPRLALVESSPVYYIFFTMFTFTVIAFSARLFGIVFLPPDVDASRVLFHSVYLLFYFFIFLSLHRVFVLHSDRRQVFFKWLFVYPFVFISIWGTYQWISTFDTIPYVWIFNNNVSTGFTYYRFMHDHRTASIFPEPSEYSYYLCLLGPLLWANFRKKIPEHTGGLLAKTSIFLWFTQAFFVNSLTFVVGAVFVMFSVLRLIEKVRLFLLIPAMVLSGLMFLSVFVSTGAWTRVLAAVSGLDSSVLVRFTVATDALELASLSPIFGYGYGIIRGIDGVTFLLACFGFFGFFIIILLFLNLLYRLKCRAPIAYFASLIPFFAGALVSNNIFGHIFFWTILAYFVTFRRSLS